MNSSPSAFLSKALPRRLSRAAAAPSLTARPLPLSPPSAPTPAATFCVAAVVSALGVATSTALLLLRVSAPVVAGLTPAAPRARRRSGPPSTTRGPARSRCGRDSPCVLPAIPLHHTPLSPLRHQLPLSIQCLIGQVDPSQLPPLPGHGMLRARRRPLPGIKANLCSPSTPYRSPSHPRRHGTWTQAPPHT